MYEVKYITLFGGDEFSAQLVIPENGEPRIEITQDYKQVKMSFDELVELTCRADFEMEKLNKKTPRQQ